VLSRASRRLPLNGAVVTEAVKIVEPSEVPDLVGQPGSFGEDARAMLWIWLTQALPAA
jgi:hypothetical protein